MGWSCVNMISSKECGFGKHSAGRLKRRWGEQVIPDTTYMGASVEVAMDKGELEGHLVWSNPNWGISGHVTDLYIHKYKHINCKNGILLVLKTRLSSYSQAVIVLVCHCSERGGIYIKDLTFLPMAGTTQATWYSWPITLLTTPQALPISRTVQSKWGRNFTW